MPYLTHLRHCFLLPIASGRAKAVINAISNLTYWDPVENEAPSFQPELRYQLQNGSVARFYITRTIQGLSIPHLGPSAGTGEQWDVYQIMPKGLYPPNAQPTWPKNLGTIAMNKLGRFILNHDEENQDAQGRPFIGMPMTFQEVFERYPSAANRYLRPQRQILDGDGEPTGETEPIPGSVMRISPTVGGMNARQVAEIDYRPTEQNMQDDDDAPDTVWPWVDE